MEGRIGYEFDHIHIMCTDPAATERWFIDGIGADLVGRYDSLGTQITKLRLAGIEILLRPARPGERLEVAPVPRYGEEHFGLRVSDLDATAAALRTRGVIFDLEPRDFGPASRIAFVRGPDNLRIELVERKATSV